MVYVNGKGARAGLWNAFTFLRVKDWLHFVPVSLLTLDPRTAGALPIARALVLSVLCLAFAYGWNTVKDEHLDQPGTLAPPRLASLRFVLVALVVLALSLAAWSGLKPFVAAMMSLSGSALYSGGPRLKALPVVGTLTNAWIFVPLALLGASEQNVQPEHWRLLGVFTLMLLQNQLLHEACHALDDSAEGIQTTIVRFGVRFGSVVAIILGLTAVVLLVAPFLSSRCGFPVVLASVPLGLLSLCLTPGRLADVAIVCRLRRLQRWCGVLAGAVAWLATLELLVC
jgi:4-hydroxybenzoate polyprenyltransferase